MELLSKCCNIFCCKNRIAVINPPVINRDNKPEFVNDENVVNEENEIYIKYIKNNSINTKTNTYSNYDDFDYNQPLPEIPKQLHHNTIPIIKQENNTNLVFSNTEPVPVSQEVPPLPPKVELLAVSV